MKTGVYFLADDGVFDLVVAFLNSFRKHNPEISLCLIPFSRQMQRIESLRERYRFSIYSNNEVLSHCDQVSTHFHLEVLGHYRKLACWEGPFEEFVYIDVDTVVLANVNFVFRFLDEYDFVTSHSNLPEIMHWVWNPSIFSTERLSHEQIAFAANTGFVASKRSALTLNLVDSKLASAIELAPHMSLSCKEQPFLNYLIVTSGKRYTSLLVLAGSKASRGIMLEHWAGAQGPVAIDGRMMVNDKPAPILLVHWAGEWEPRLSDRFVLFMLHLFRVRRRGNVEGVRLFMPYKKLWEYYRFLEEKN